MGDRFDFQRDMVFSAHGVVLNLGCNEDPAQLKYNFPSRVLNCDLEWFDKTMGRANAADQVFDIAARWPFPDGFALMSVFGDVLEHLPPKKIVKALREAARVSQRLAITVPEDTRIDGTHTYEKGVYNPHLTVVTERLIRDCMDKSGWRPIAFFKIPWGFDGIYGYCIEAERD